MFNIAVALKLSYASTVATDYPSLGVNQKSAKDAAHTRILLHR